MKKPSKKESSTPNKKDLKTPKKRNLSSEAAQREAASMLRNNKAYLAFSTFGQSSPLNRFQVACFRYRVDGVVSELIAVFDLRDCFRKRKPLTGITKKLRSAIQPRRNKK